jgi:hypothetical protein
MSVDAERSIFLAVAFMLAVSQMVPVRATRFPISRRPCERRDP